MKTWLGAGIVAVVAGGVAVLSLVADPAPARLAPADGATLITPPAEVALTFPRPVAAREAHLTVAAPDGTSVGIGQPVWLDRSLVLPVRADTGSYLVAYHVVLADGRVVAGVGGFSVGQESMTAGAHAHQGDPVNLTLTGVAAMSIVALLILLFSRRRHGNGTGQSARPSHDTAAS